MSANSNFWKNRMAVAAPAGSASQSPAPEPVSRQTPSRPLPAGTVRVIPVIDPVFRAGKLEIPVDKTFPTKGRDDWLGGVLRKDLSLCCLFQKGRCHADAKCHQVHVDRDFVVALRSEQSKIVSCCRHCNDTASSTPAALSFFACHATVVVKIACPESRGAVNVLPLGRLAYTPGLEQAASELPPNATEFVISGRKVCRLHLSGACKYGKDCKNVHVCSKLGEGVLKPGFTHDACPAVSSAPTSMVSSQRSTPQPQAAALPGPISPLPSFSVPSSAPTKSSDPLEICEGSGRLGSIAFDPTMALEDSQSQMRPSASDPVYELSPGQKRRTSLGSTGSAGGCTASVTNSPPHAFALPSWHPASHQAAADANESAKVPVAEQQSNFLRFFVL